MWTPEMVLKKCFKLIDSNACGHCFMHERMNIEWMIKRMADEHKMNVSCFTISTELLQEDIKYVCTDWAQDLADWLNDGDFSKENMKISAFAELNHNVGQLLSKEKWAETGKIYECHFIIVVFKKFLNTHNDIDFKIITAYCDLTDAEKEIELSKREL